MQEARFAKSLLQATQAVGLMIGCAAAAHAQEIIARGPENPGLIAAMIVVALLPIIEAAIYRVAARVRIIRALGLSILLNVAAYGLIVLWLRWLPDGVNPWFAYMVDGGASGFTVGQAFIAALICAVGFVVVKVPALIWWLRDGGPDRRLTVTVLLTNLVLFLAMSDAIAFIVDAL